MVTINGSNDVMQTINFPLNQCSDTFVCFSDQSIKYFPTALSLKAMLRSPGSVGERLPVLIVLEVGVARPEVLAVLHSDRLVYEGAHLLQPRLGTLGDLVRVLDMESVA